MKDPTRWNEVLIDSPFATLTKRDVHDYYANPEIQRKILDATAGKETIVRQSFSPGEPVLRRKDPSGNFIRLSSPEKLEEWNQIRATEFHPVFGRRTDTLLADIDPGSKVDWKTTKSIAETIAKTLDGLDDVKKTEVFFSGDRGFYVRSQLEKKMDIDKARAKVQETLHGIAQRPDVTFGVAKPDQIRIDTSVVKYRGSTKAPYSLSARTGLVSAPVKIEDLPKTEKEDFKIEKIVKKAESISFPKREHTSLKGRLRAGKEISTSRVSSELGKYRTGDILQSPLGDLVVQKIQRIKDLAGHPHLVDLTKKQKQILNKYPAVDIVTLRKKAAAIEAIHYIKEPGTEPGNMLDYNAKDRASVMKWYDEHAFHGGEQYLKDRVALEKVLRQKAIERLGEEAVELKHPLYFVVNANKTTSKFLPTNSEKNEFPIDPSLLERSTFTAGDSFDIHRRKKKEGGTLAQHANLYTLEEVKRNIKKLYKDMLPREHGNYIEGQLWAPYETKGGAVFPKEAAENGIDLSSLSPLLQKDLSKALKSYSNVQDQAHGSGHIENVVRAANLMNQKFKLPQDQVMAASILHDIGRRAEDLGKGRHEELGAKIAPRYLKSFDEPTREAIVHAVREHRFSKSNPQTPLAKMINDADTLSDFMSSSGKDYFFRRLFDYRKAHGFSHADALPDARTYAGGWLSKALGAGGLKTTEALDVFGRDLRRAKQIADNEKRWRKIVEPIASEVYQGGQNKILKKEGAEVNFDLIRFLDMFDEHIPKFLRYRDKMKQRELAAQQAQGQPYPMGQAKVGSEEFAPGIPKSRTINPIPEVKNKAWTLAVQKHEALKAGPHFDFRLVDPKTNQAHSFAVPKMKLPKPGEPMVLAIQQPTHTADYALHFEGDIPKGTYGAGKVTLPIKEPIQVIKSNADRIHLQRENGDELVMFRTKGNNWGLKAKEK